MECCGRPISSGCRELVDFLFTNITGGKNARNLCAAVLIGCDIAAVRQCKLVDKEIGIGQHADVDKKTIHWQTLCLSCIFMEQLKGSQTVISYEMLNLRFEHDRDFLIGIECVL